MFTGIRDLDKLILLKLDDEKDLYSACKINKYFYSIYQEDNFWMLKFFNRFGLYLDKKDVSKYRQDKSWKEYYLELYKVIFSKYPYFISALYTDEEVKRHDILTLLEKIAKINNVTKVYLAHGDLITEEYYTRDGDIDGVREGLGVFSQTIDRTEHCWERLYRNGFTLIETYSQNNNLKYYQEYRGKGANRISKHVQFSSKGKIVREEIFEKKTRFCLVTSYFVNGKLRSKGLKLKGNKHGKWQYFSKDGTLNEKTYHLGKKLSRI